MLKTQDITDLPLLSRNFFNLPLLVPGVVSAGGSINTFALSVNGNREYGNSIQIDGVESTTNRTQDVTVVPSVDSVQELLRSPHRPDNAEFGSSAGGVISIQTKAGTNALHGDTLRILPAELSGGTALCISRREVTIADPEAAQLRRDARRAGKKR